MGHGWLPYQLLVWSTRGRARVLHDHRAPKRRSRHARSRRRAWRCGRRRRAYQTPARQIARLERMLFVNVEVVGSEWCAFGWVLLRSARYVQVGSRWLFSRRTVLHRDAGSTVPDPIRLIRRNTIPTDSCRPESKEVTEKNLHKSRFRPRFLLVLYS